MTIAFALGYLFAGCVLAVPYCLLAGWHTIYFVIIAVLAPTVAFLLLWFATAAGIAAGVDRWRVQVNWKTLFTPSAQIEPGSFARFWFLALLVLLPLLTNAAAEIMLANNLTGFGQLLKEYRYALPFIFATVSCALFVLVYCVSDFGSQEDTVIMDK